MLDLLESFRIHAAGRPLLIALVASEASYGAMVPGLIVTGLGVGVFYPTITTAGVTAVDESRSSLAGAIIYMFQIGGGSVGLGLTTTIFIGESDRATGGPEFINGIQTAFGVDAAIAAGGFLLATFLIGGRPRIPVEIHRLHAGPSPRGHGP